MTEAADDPAVLTDRTAALLRAIEAHLQELLRLSTTYVNKEALVRDFARRIVAECERRPR